MEKKLEKEDLEITSAKAITRLGRMKATKTEINDKKILVRTKSNEKTNEIFKALHYRPPSRVEIIS